MQRMSLHARDWEEMATLDPMWAILSTPEKRFGNWELNEFLRTGEEEIAGLMQVAEGFALPKQRRRAIDFGCGIGRLTRALQARFPEAYGVDISGRMLEMAGRLTPGCSFREGHDLSSFPDRSADLIYSILVLQHQPDRAHAEIVIRDMARVLAPGGLLAFQIPIHMPLRNRIQLRRKAYRILRTLGVREEVAYRKLKLSPIRMLWIPRDRVEQLVQKAGARVIHVKEIRDAPFTSGLFYCTVNE